MPSKRFDEIRDYAFADQALALRKRLGVTQIELAAELGVTNQSVYAWEAGLSNPGAARLKQLLAFYLEHGALDAGRELEHAEQLWETVRARATRRLEPFDPAWLTSRTVTDRLAAPQDLPPTNLPPSRTRFFGREDAIADLRTALEHAREADERLLTLAGVAGCGKTRLALAVAQSVRATFTGGVWFINLAPLPASSSADPTDIVSAVLTALHLQGVTDRPPLETLIGHLQSQRLLLVLDNCEHVVAACGVLATRVLAACPQVQLLTTSQYPLGLGDETLWPVDTLSVPALVDGEPTPEALDMVRQTEAVQLFVDRARVVQPDFALTVETAATVSAICRELDGLPLAIELAAARLNLLSTEELFGRLTNRFAVLRRGGRTVADRHQTLQATMDWSYRLLTSSDQTVLRQLAVFVGGWDLAAAEAVCANELQPAEAILETLDELQARSLIDISTTDGNPRYGMLETVRYYGLQQLHLTGETAMMRDRHLAWCVRLAEEAAPALTGRQQAAWLARLQREHDNLRVGIQWALDRGLAGPGLRVATAVAPFWRSHGYLSEGRHWFAALLALPAENDDTSLTVRASAMEGAAELAQDAFDFAQAAALFAQSAAVRRTLGQDESSVGALINTALEARASGDYVRATALLEENLTQHHSRNSGENILESDPGPSRGQAYEYTLLALVLREQGEFRRATGLLNECMVLQRRWGDAGGMGNVLLGLADIARDQGDTTRVRAYSDESLAIFRALGMQWAIGFVLNNLALAAYKENDLSEAARLASRSEAIFRDAQNRLSLPEVLITVGRVRSAQGDTSAAQRSLVEALDLARQEGPRLFVATALEALAVEAVRGRHVQDAVTMLGAVAELRRTMGAPVRPVDRADLDRTLEEARRLLGPEAFSEVWRTGQILSVEQVVDQLDLSSSTSSSTQSQSPIR